MNACIIDEIKYRINIFDILIYPDIYKAFIALNEKYIYLSQIVEIKKIINQLHGYDIQYFPEKPTKFVITIKPENFNVHLLKIYIEKIVNVLVRTCRPYDPTSQYFLKINSKKI